MKKIEGYLLDTGPLVAYLSPDDFHHAWACDRMAECDGSLITCEAVMTEAFFLLRHHAPHLSALERMLSESVFDLSFSLANEARAVVALRKGYRNIPMSLADACIVRISEIHPHVPVLTIDSDFTVYRRNKRDLIPVIAPTR